MLRRLGPLGIGHADRHCWRWTSGALPRPAHEAAQSVARDPGSRVASPGLQSVLQGGGRVVLTDTTEPAEAFRLIEQERVTHTSLVPAPAMRWLDAAERERFDLSSLRVLQVGGATLNHEPAQRVRPTLGCQLQQVFGMAEGLLNYNRTT